MAWTTPRTWATNETLTAANMNTHVRDALNWLANDHPRCRATRTATQSMASGGVAVSFTGTETYDVGSMHDGATNPSRITVPSGGAGVYTIVGWAAMDNSTATRTYAEIRLNGTQTLGEVVATPPSTSGAHMNPSAIMLLAVGDYVELFINHNAGASVNVTAAAMAVNWIAF